MADVFNVSVTDLTGTGASVGSPAAAGGRFGDQLMSPIGGKYAAAARAGILFHGATAAAGVVIPISTSLTPTFSLWNPAGSGYDFELVCFKAGWSATTAVLGTIGYTFTANAGNGISSTAPFVAFGTGTPMNAKFNGGRSSAARLAGGGTTTLVAASTNFTNSGIVTAATTAATTTAPMWIARDDIDGTIILEPGNAMHIMGSTAVAVTLTIDLSWIEWKR